MHFKVFHNFIFNFFFKLILFLGIAVQKLIEHFGWTEVALISSQDAYGVDAADVFTKAVESNSSNTKVSFYSTFPAGSSSTIDALNGIKRSNTRVSPLLLFI